MSADFDNPDFASPPSENQSMPPTVEPLEATDYSEFLLHARGDILFVLRSLMEQSSLISAYLDTGSDFFLTTLLACGDDEIFLDIGNEDDINEKVLKAEKLVCITSLDRVRVQFILRRVAPAMQGSKPAFRAALPDALLRLQRREYFRLPAPLAQPLKCDLPLKCLADGKVTVVPTRVLDISGGGLAVHTPADAYEFFVGMEIPRCRLDLPGVGLITPSLRVSSIFEVNLVNNTRGKRAGCQFIHMPGTMNNLVQRYIINLERARKARETGLR